MAVGFKVNIFANKFNLAYKQNSLVEQICSTEYTTGKVKGDRVTISKILVPDPIDYVQGVEIVGTAVASTEIVVIMDKQKLIQMYVEDIDEAQSNPSIMNAVATDGAKKMTKQTNKDVLAKLIADANTNTDTLTMTATLTEANVKAELLSKALTFLNTADAPTEGRYIVVDPTTYSLMAGLDIAESDVGLGKEFGGRTMGMNIFWSNDLPASRCLVGVKEASEFGFSVKSVKTGLSEKHDADFIRMINVYGSGVVKDGVAEIVLV